MTTAFISHPLFLQHKMADNHPEQPDRLKEIQYQLEASGLQNKLTFYTAPKASFEQIKQVHDSSYVDHLIKKSPLQDGLEQNEEVKTLLLLL